MRFRITCSAAAAAAVLGGCLLTSSLDRLSAGSNDVPPSEAGTVEGGGDASDATASIDAGAGPCTGAGLVFCDELERESLLAGQWIAVPKTTNPLAFLMLDDTTAKSGRRSLRATVTTQAPPWSAALLHSIPPAAFDFRTERLRFEADIRADRSPNTPAVNVLELSFPDSGTSSISLQLGEMLRVTEEPNGGKRPFVRRHIDEQEWVHVTMLLDARQATAAPSIEVTVGDETTSLVLTLAHAFAKTDIIVGLVYVATAPASTWTMNIDNIAVHVE